MDIQNWFPPPFLCSWNHLGVPRGQSCLLRRCWTTGSVGFPIPCTAGSRGSTNRPPGTLPWVGWWVSRTDSANQVSFIISPAFLSFSWWLINLLCTWENGRCSDQFKSMTLHSPAFFPPTLGTQSFLMPVNKLIKVSLRLQGRWKTTGRF